MSASACERNSLRLGLLLLCEMCGSDLVPGNCLLGAADLEGDCSASGRMTAVLRILKDLLTPLTGAPRRAADAEATTDVQALGHVASIAEVCIVDASADEQLAGGCCSVLAAAPWT